MGEGRADNVQAETVYAINAKLDTHELRVWWEIAPPEVAATVPKGTFQHTYSIVSSALSAGRQKMVRGPDDQGTWETTVVIGPAGEEEFQLLRDSDTGQVFYPTHARAVVPGTVLGPDSMANGRQWLLQGAVGERFRVQLHIARSHVTVTTRSRSSGTRSWCSVADC